MIDLHSHLIPAVDDGARDALEAAAGLDAMSRSGVKLLVTTPHLNASELADASGLEQRMAQLDEGWAALQEVAAGRGTEVRRGVELRLDAPGVPDLADDRLRLGGGPAVLVEFAHMTAPPRAADVLYQIRSRGWFPILAHPERYRGLDDLAAVRALATVAALQANVGSVLGWYGEDPKRRIERLLENGLVHMFSSDFHARGEPGISRARERLGRSLDERALRLLFEENPGRVLEGRAPLAVPPTRAGRRLWRLFQRAG